MRLSAVAVAVALVACDQATTPPAQILRLNPDVVAVSGAASVKVDVTNDGAGELLWRATLAHPGNQWLSVTPDTGTAGQGASPLVGIDPTGLAFGVYQDTIYFAARAGRTAPVPLVVSLNLAPAAAPHLDFAVQPTATKLGSAITPPVVVCLRDSAGQIVTTFNSVVTLRPGTGTTSVNAVAGCATFSNIRPATVGTFTLTASAGSWQDATSASFQVN